MSTAVDPPAIPVSLDASWRAALADEFAAPYMADLKRFLHERKEAGARIYPRGKAKVELALAKGRKAPDKREYVKEREWKRDQGRIMRERG